MFTRARLQYRARSSIVSQSVRALGAEKNVRPYSALAMQETIREFNWEQLPIHLTARTLLPVIIISLVH